MYKRIQLPIQRRRRIRRIRRSGSSWKGQVGPVVSFRLLKRRQASVEDLGTRRLVSLVGRAEDRGITLRVWVYLLSWSPLDTGVAAFLHPTMKRSEVPEAVHDRSET